jgi:hypothetical protein
MTKDEALDLALEALEGVLDDSPKVLEASIAGGLYEVIQCRDAITAIKQARAAPTVQELQRYSPDGEGGMELDSLGAYIKLQDVAAPPAQPAVPDAMTSADIQEHIEYVAGWNDCRQAMLEMMK